MSNAGIEKIARNAIKALLVSNGSQIVSGLSSNGVALSVPVVTTSSGTKPVDGMPFMAINVDGRGLEFGNSPLSVDKSDTRVNLILRNSIEPELRDDNPYELGSNNHSDIGDRIIAVIVNTFKNGGGITDPDTKFKFKLKPEDGMDKRNSGIAGNDEDGYYVVEVSEITFTIRSQCEETTY